MNKRIKLKKGILHKRCDDNCYNYRMIVDAMFITNNSCSNWSYCELVKGEIKMRKFIVKVITTKEFEIELDDEKITEEYLDSFESAFYPLDEEDDRIKSMAGDYCRLRAKFGQCFIEGYGHVLERGKVPLSAKLNNDKPNDKINILDYYDDDVIEVDEL